MHRNALASIAWGLPLPDGGGWQTAMSMSKSWLQSRLSVNRLQDQDLEGDALRSARMDTQLLAKALRFDKGVTLPQPLNIVYSSVSLLNIPPTHLSISGGVKSHPLKLMSKHFDM